MTYCRRHGCLDSECLCPHTPTRAELLDMAQEDAADAQESFSRAWAGTWASEPREALRGPHSKPVILRNMPWGWFVTLECCAHRDDVRLFTDFVRTQSEAMDAALAHVAEVHDRHSVEHEVAFWDEHYADVSSQVKTYEYADSADTDPASDIWADALDSSHNHSSRRNA